ncbi:MAG: EAL domain-containing protein [Burkholderiales bacterium]|nr:EAL domain-containing protein [Burkholderiales bacterium]
MKTNTMRLWTQNLQHWWHVRKGTGVPYVRAVLEKRSLGAVFQPMVELRTGAIMGHEGLVRVPRSVAEMSFDGLMGAAKAQHCQKQLELTCVDHVIGCWLAERGKGMLFVNVSAQTLVQLHESDAIDSLLQLLRKHKLPPARMGIDLAGYTRLSSVDALVAALRPLRAAGMAIALDDFKATDSSMRVWSKVLPNLIKMAPRWTSNIHRNPDHRDAVASMVRLTRKHGGLLVAKSVENESEMQVLRELGVSLAQGYFLGSPGAEPVTALNRRAHGALSVETPTVTARPDPVLEIQPADPSWWG